MKAAQTASGSLDTHLCAVIPNMLTPHPNHRQPGYHGPQLAVWGRLKCLENVFFG